MGGKDGAAGVIERLKTPRAMREGQRDVTTMLCGSVVTLIAWAFGIADTEATGALTTVLIIICHRKLPDMAGRRGT